MISTSLFIPSAPKWAVLKLLFAFSYVVFRFREFSSDSPVCFLVWSLLFYLSESVRLFSAAGSFPQFFTNFPSVCKLFDYILCSSLFPLVCLLLSVACNFTSHFLSVSFSISTTFLPLVYLSTVAFRFLLSLFFFPSPTVLILILSLPLRTRPSAIPGRQYKPHSTDRTATLKI